VPFERFRTAGLRRRARADETFPSPSRLDSPEPVMPSTPVIPITDSRSISEDLPATGTSRR
jgi:hypothetical protein